MTHWVKYDFKGNVGRDKAKIRRIRFLPTTQCTCLTTISHAPLTHTVFNAACTVCTCWVILYVHAFAVVSELPLRTYYHIYCSSIPASLSPRLISVHSPNGANKVTEIQIPIASYWHQTPPHPSHPLPPSVFQTGKSRCWPLVALHTGMGNEVLLGHIRCKYFMTVNRNLHTLLEWIPKVDWFMHIWMLGGNLHYKKNFTLFLFYFISLSGKF